MTRRGIYSSACALFFSLSSYCQSTLQILDATTRQPVAYVSVTDKTTKATTRTNEQGRFNLSVKAGDTLLCSHPAYNFSIQYITADKKVLYMYPLVHRLKEVEVTTDMAKFQRDSAERRAIYRKTVLDSKFKPSTPKRQGLKVDGLVTAFVYKVSGKAKKNKKFVAQMEADEQEKYISIRYSKGLVERLIPLRGDSVRLFIEHFPMSYEFARSATDLELKNWILNNYKSWANHK